MQDQLPPKRHARKQPISKPRSGVMHRGASNLLLARGAMSLPDAAFKAVVIGQRISIAMLAGRTMADILWYAAARLRKIRKTQR